MHFLALFWLQGFHITYAYDYKYFYEALHVLVFKDISDVHYSPDFQALLSKHLSLIMIIFTDMRKFRMSSDNTQTKANVEQEQTFLSKSLKIAGVVSLYWYVDT